MDIRKRRKKIKENFRKFKVYLYEKKREKETLVSSPSIPNVQITKSVVGVRIKRKKKSL